jgi:prepilin-type N-terminal cleavage/methylation domain-containing protein
MRRGQRGFTLIELMVALVVSSLLVGMILAIFSRMSLAYRGQQQIAGVQQVLAAARAAIELDAKQAGLAMTQGFTVAPGISGATLSPIQIIDNDNNKGPDQVAFFYADPTTQAVVKSSAWPNSVTVDSSTGFAPGDLIVLSTADTTQNGPFAGEATITRYTACVVQIDPAPGSVAAGPPATINIAGAGVVPWGGTSHCAAPTTSTMVYKLVAHAYRIDTTPARAALGALQMSSTGGLIAGEVWSELAYGFTDIQTALRIYQQASVGNPDGDADPNRDWFSGTNQSNVNTVPATQILFPEQISISLVARTDRDVEGVSTQSTPNLTGAIPDNNEVGNRAAIALPSQPPWLADPALQGSKIYRYVTFQVDFRNLGVGR